MGLFSRLWARVPFRQSLKISVYFEESATVRGVRGEIIGGLKERVCYIKEAEDQSECDVRVYFCPIVSRAGTDINAVLGRVKDGKPIFVIVLQHTFDRQAVAINCREYEREGLVLVTFLFSEDQGLLKCQKNNEAFEKATNYLTKWTPEEDGSRNKKIILSYILPTAKILGVLIFVHFVRRWFRRPNRHNFWPGFIHLFYMVKSRPTDSKSDEDNTIQNPDVIKII